MTTIRLQSVVQGGQDSSGCYLACATTPDGRRFWYCWPDGKPRDSQYLRPLTHVQYTFLADAVARNGGIDVTKFCWQEGEPVYGSPAYEAAGVEGQELRRELEDGDYMGLTLEQEWIRRDAFACAY